VEITVFIERCTPESRSTSTQSQTEQCRMLSQGKASVAFVTVEMVLERKEQLPDVSHPKEKIL